MQVHPRHVWWVREYVFEEKSIQKNPFISELFIFKSLFMFSLYFQVRHRFDNIWRHKSMEIAK